MLDSAALALPLAPPTEVPSGARARAVARPPLSLVSPPAPRAEPEASAPEPAEGLPFERTVLIEHIPALRRRALHWCRDAAAAEDLVQETLLRAFRHKFRERGEFATPGHLRAWLYTVLRNLFISAQRRERSARHAIGALEHTPIENGPSGAPFLLPSLERALGGLPEAFARVICLVDLQEHSYADAAAVLGVPIGTVMSRLSRGRQRLAQALVAAERERCAPH
jgi:RNA polymerase sigma-70 factor (ECF subfamily)